MKLKTSLLLLLTCSSLLVSAQAQSVTIKQFPTPDTVSKEMQSLVAGPPFPYWNEHPQTAQKWKQ